VTLQSINKTAGFTLVELLIVLAIISIIMLVAIPNYYEQVARGKRAEGKAFLLDLASRQERYYTQYSSYANALGAGGLGVAASGETTVDSPEAHYTVSLSALPSGCAPASDSLCTGYTLTAAPKPTGSDERCGSLTYTHAGKKGISGGTESLDYCWR